MEEKKKSIREEFVKFLASPENNREGLLKSLENTREAWKRERGRFEKTWRDNLSFYKGNHYVRDVARNDSQYRVRVKENHINNAMARMVSIFVQNLPVVRSFPASSQEIDIENAENIENYSKYVWRKKKIEILCGNFVKHTAMLGGSYLFHHWDPYAGGKMVLDSSETKSGETEEKIYRGDHRLFFASPFRVLVRPGIYEWDDMYDVMRSEPASRAEFEAIYGKIDADPATSFNSATGEARREEDQILVHHYYHKPTCWFEEGIYACWTGKTLLKAIIWPVTKGEPKLPGVYLPFDNVTEQFHGMSNIEQVIDLQEQLNNAASMIIQARNLVARPRVFSSHEAAIPIQSLTDEPGIHVRYKLAGGPPIFNVPPFNFAELSAHKADVRSALEKVIGVTSATRGEVPAATRTALALQLVLEQDRSQYVPFIRRWHQSIQDLMYGVLMDAAEFIPESDPRIVKIQGESGATMFHGGMVPSELDIYLEDTNPLGYTAAGRIEQVGVLIDKGLVKDRNQALEMLKIHAPDPAYEELTRAREAARQEIERLNKGEELDPMPEDNDPLHLEEHIKPVQNFSFRSRPPHVQSAHLNHIQKHKDRIAAFQGGAPGAGAPPAGPGMPKGPAGAVQELVGVNTAPNPGQNLDQLLTASRSG